MSSRHDTVSSAGSDPAERSTKGAAERAAAQRSHVYLIGSLKNDRIPVLAAELRAAGLSVFDDWHCAGPDADDVWQQYENDRGRSYAEALDGAHAQCVFEFDKLHIDAADGVVLVLPAGKSGHLELGYAVGSGKPAYILLDGAPERFDVMYRFATKVVDTPAQLIAELRPVPDMAAQVEADYRQALARRDYQAFLAGR